MIPAGESIPVPRPPPLPAPPANPEGVELTGEAGARAALEAGDAAAHQAAAPPGPNPIDTLSGMLELTASLLGPALGVPPEDRDRLGKLTAGERGMLELTRPGLDELLGEDSSFLSSRKGALLVVISILAGRYLPVVARRFKALRSRAPQPGTEVDEGSDGGRPASVVPGIATAAG